jgi:hypothetical protein
MEDNEKENEARKEYSDSNPVQSASVINRFQINLKSSSLTGESEIPHRR